MSEAENKKMIRYLAILRVFDKHIANFCYAHSNSSADAQDLSQEILALVWENLDGLKADTDAPARVNRWLNKVMFTAFVRHLRQRPRITTVPLSDAVDVADSPEVDPEEVEDHLSRLGDNDRHLLKMRIEGYTNAEIARFSRRTENSVAQQFYRIFIKLRKKRNGTND